MSLPETIQAIAFQKNGGVEVLEKLSFPFPEHKPGDILIKVCAFQRSRSSYTDRVEPSLSLGCLWRCQYDRHLLQVRDHISDRLCTVLIKNIHSTQEGPLSFALLSTDQRRRGFWRDRQAAY